MKSVSMPLINFFWAFSFVQAKATALLKQKIDSILKEQPDVLGFIIDGYPRTVEQKEAFETEVSNEHVSF